MPETSEDLHESREWLRITLESIGDGVITTDAQGRVTLVNAVAESLTGWTQADATGRLLTDVFHIVNQDTRAVVDNPALRALREGVIVGLANHTILIARDGRERNIDDSAAPIRNSKGEVAGTVLVFRDITERYALERTIEDSLAFTTSILDTQREPFLVLDRELRVVRANRAFYDLFAVKQEETEHQPLYTLGNGQWNIPALRELLEQILPGNGHAFDGYEVDHVFELIGRRHMLLNARQLRRHDGNTGLILLAIEDETERSEAREMLRTSEVRYRRLFQTAKDGVLILDADSGRILDANAFMSALTGLEYRELTGKQLYEIGMFSDIEENKAAFRELQRNQYLRHEHLPLKNRRGERVEVEFIANVYAEDGRSVAQCNVRDISERVAMEKTIMEQTLALAQESRRKDEFLALLSHELRNPLAPIRSAAHVLGRLDNGNAENPLHRQARDIIERQVGNLTKLISDLLEVSRVLSGRVHLERQMVDLCQVLDHALETVAPFISNRRHVVTLHACHPDAWVSADSTRLEQVLVNVLDNAAKYTPEGGLIEVWCDVIAAEQKVQIRVRDNGPGIDAKLRPHIFDLFSQAERTLDRAQGGLGIGLALAQRLVVLHGGTIEVQSPPPGSEVGSEFIVQLALASVHAPATTSADERPGSPASPGQRVRVLVVDDNADLVLLIQSDLEHEGYEVRAAYTGPDGLRIGREWRPDVALLDIGLPGLDGYQVARQLRADPGAASIKLIAVSGYGRDTDVALAFEAGFDQHLTKPVDAAQLTAAIQQLT